LIIDANIKKIRPKRRIYTRQSISRVLYLTIICLGAALPMRSSDFLDKQATYSRFSLASSGVYMALRVTSKTVVSYTAFPSLPTYVGGLFLLHFPSSRLDR